MGVARGIGRVESNHGRYDRNTLGTDGVARPGIYGIPLDGHRNTAEIRDTDAGRLDHDEAYDRAVGPMQFIPSTWSAVGVDADGDSVRNPQDIDDAALAAAVYLCSGADDLSVEAGRRGAVHRYNHSQPYVDLVLSVMKAYMAGAYSAVPEYVASAVTFTPDEGYVEPTKGAPGGKSGGSHADASDQPSVEPDPDDGKPHDPEPHDPEPHDPEPHDPEPHDAEPYDPQPEGSADNDPVKTIETTVTEILEAAVTEEVKKLVSRDQTMGP